ncbi:MAG: class I SAM-dependent methyltransferase [Candidatus Dormibacteraeota bacterium]|nr:class I SAM-dependent methyltransferase [Candidatus Dormibacteraeota bacterium]
MEVSRRELAQTLLTRSLDLVEWADGGPTPEQIARSGRFAWADTERCLAATDLARPVLEGTAGARVLDVGAGYLYMSSAFRMVFGDAVTLCTLEHPARTGTLSNDRFVSALQELRVELRTADLAREELPWEEGSFDVVLFCDVIEHMEPTVVPTVVERLGRLLKPGGRLVISSPNLPAFCRLASLAFGRGAIQAAAVPLEYAGGTYGHIRLYGRVDVEELMSETGLRLADWRFLNWEQVFLPRDSLGRRLMYGGQAIAPLLARRLATSWIAACERDAAHAPRRSRPDVELAVR